MRRSRLSDAEILALLDEANRGGDPDIICRDAGVSVRTFYRWRKRFEGVSADRIGRLAELEAEVRRLRRQLASNPNRAAASPGNGTPVRSEVGTVRLAGATTPAPGGAKSGRFAGLRC